ncbi:MAG: carbohydrate kinase family protein, partial [Kiritimatiellae bacterium]|nr:carbohydrate kinase family protein [Kiritimatiellia bacterium]
MPTSAPHQAIVAGHIALDIIPIFKTFAGGLNSLLTPGKLIEVGGPVIAAGGAVHNTGLALHRLGIATGLIGKVGDNLLGRAIMELIRAEDRRLTEGMLIVAGENTSYSVVLSPPGVDRI